MAATGGQNTYARLSGRLVLNLTLLFPALLSQQEYSPGKDEGAYVCIFIQIQGSDSSFDPLPPHLILCKGSRNVWQQEDQSSNVTLITFCIDYTPRLSQNCEHHFWGYIKVFQI